ncbi:MAG TPA: transglycosylase domain-containing protein [Actinomycetota bacterium]|nr:transglycosylase domain-containing protein [Actinomycetota bacterium]
MRRPAPAHKAPSDPLSDRWAFKPVAFLLLLATLVASAGLLAILISPPFLAAGAGVQKIQGRLNADGAKFTGIPRLPQRSTIYASDGKTVLARIYLDNREVVPLNRISPNVIKAVLAIEDSQFYNHGAIDLASVIRAIGANIRSGSFSQGGSTITQQLVKNTIGNDAPTLERKFRELALAERVEQHYSKDQILDLYLNDVFLANNVYGIGTAARFYFHESAAHLNLPQAALLAGLIQSPSYDDPVAHPRHAYLRRNDVLNRMIALGQAHDPNGVSVKRGEAAKNRPIVLHTGGNYLPTPPFLVDYVRQELVDDPNGWYGVLGNTPQERENTLKEGGLSIITTLNPDWQKAAQKAASQPWAVAPANPGYSPEPDVGIVSLGTRTGAIQTMLSGRNYQKDQLNLVTMPHQPGSSFKPYVLATAFEQGIPPTATFSGAQGPIAGCFNQDGSVWNVTNAEGTSLGMVNLYDGTAYSINAVFARLTETVGPQNVADMAHRLGITTPLPAVCSLGTGSVGITPLDQASGYQTFANSGIHCTPYAVSEIRRNNKVLYDQTPDCNRVLAAPIANLVNKVLEGPVTYGTAASVFSSGWGKWPIRGKTGTADSNKELWFAGYTRQVTTAVWVGSPHTPYPMPNYWGQSVFGGTIAAPIWKAYMLEVLQGMPARQFPAAELGRVPSVVGMDEQTAIRTLRSAGFRADVNVVQSYLPQGQVLTQDPGAGAQSVAGITVKLAVSNGVAKKVTIPSVKGLSLGSAEAALSGINVTPVVVYKQTTDPTLDGIVIQVTPDAGTVVLEGTSATLYVWQGPAPSSSPTPSPSPGGGGGHGNGNGGGNPGNGNGNGH